MTRRVLVVDDEQDTREVARLSLERLGGHEVLTAASGDEALAIAERDQPDAILLDVMMPGQDGPATLAALRGLPATAGIPVVFLTAKARQSDREALTALGAAAVITKPFDPMGLAAELGALLGWAA
jgi:CheY-like chemotaxis protein